MEFTALAAQAAQIMHRAKVDLGVVQKQAIELEKTALVIRAVKAFCRIICLGTCFFSAKVNAPIARTHAIVIEFLVANKLELKENLSLSLKWQQF